MNLADHFRAMAHNNVWSNARLHKSCARLTAVEFCRERVSYFPSLQRTLHHILIVDRNYIADLAGPGRAGVVPIPPGDAAEIAAAQVESDAAFTALCRHLDESALARAVAIDRCDGKEYDGKEYVETAGAILAHLFVHQIHHRGQAHAMLAGTEAAPPQLDEFFLASDAPLRDAELRHLGLPLP